MKIIYDAQREKSFDIPMPVKLDKLPFNVTILKPSDYNLGFLRPVTSLDIYDGASTNFHPDGLFSIETFGRVGSEERSRRPSYINIKLPIMHPHLFRELVALRGLYGEILSGRTYAVWDPALKDFVKSNELDGETGYQFFVEHFDKLEFKHNKSISRSYRIDMINKYREQNKCFTSIVMVTPAGIRDLEVDSNDRTVKDEVNDYYYRLLSIANTIIIDESDPTIGIYDNPRYQLQMASNAIYDYYEGLVTGKKGLIQGKWASRRIFNGTRNVITAMDTSTPNLDSDRTPSPLHTHIGINQLINGALPVAIHYLRNGWLSEVFSGDGTTAMLVNPETLHRELVDVSLEDSDRWTTVEGLTNVIKDFDEVEIRQQPIKINGYYLGLIYVDDESYKIFGDLDELPAELDPKNVHPLSLTTLIYLSGVERWNKLVSVNTRYPVAGMGSTYSTYVYTRTTITAKQKYPLDWNWQIDRSTPGAIEFPELRLDAPFFDSMSPHTSYLSGLTADFDGDTMSSNILYTDKAIEENVRYFHSREMYVDTDGSLKIKPAELTVELVLSNLTKV